MPQNTRVCVVVVNWNGGPLLGACLRSLIAQDFGDFHVVVVDNGSSDDSVLQVRRDFPGVDVVALPENLGFSGANNVAIKHASGEYIALLNNDAEAAPDWLGELVAVLEANPDVGSCASKMLLHSQPHLADSCGDFYSIEGIPGKIGHREPATLHNEPREVFGACAGAALYRRTLLEQLGGFDEDFFIIHEDSDLSFRARLQHSKCLYVPTAIVYHRLSASIGRESDTAVYYAQRNAEFVFFKNMPTALLVKYLPLHVITDMFLFVRYLLHKQGQVFLRAKLHALRMMPKMLKKRGHIQRVISVPAAEIDRLLLKGYLWKRLRQAPARYSSNRPQSYGADS